MKRFLSAVLVAFAITGCSDNNSVGVEEFASDLSLSRGSDDSRIRVMTRNLYIGTSTAAVVNSPPAEIPFAVAEAFQVFLSSSYEERMAALAEEIAEARPHLVGLQEVTLIRLQSPGDVLAGHPVPATEVIADFEAVLLSELAARGLDYRIVARIQNTDVELPMFVGVGEGAKGGGVGLQRSAAQRGGVLRPLHRSRWRSPGGRRRARCLRRQLTSVNKRPKGPASRRTLR